MKECGNNLRNILIILFVEIMKQLPSVYLEMDLFLTPAEYF